MKSNAKWWIGIGVIAIALMGLSFLNLGDNLVYFYTPSEAVAKAANLSGNTIRVGGLVKPGSIARAPEDPLRLSFLLTDLQGNDIQVSYRGSPPDMFKENQGVVAEGKLDASGKSMSAKTLLVKHSEEYKTPETGKTMDTKNLERSLFKNEMPSVPGGSTN